MESFHEMSSLGQLIFAQIGEVSLAQHFGGAVAENVVGVAFRIFGAFGRVVRFDHLEALAFTAILITGFIGRAFALFSLFTFGDLVAFVAGLPALEELVGEIGLRAPVAVKDAIEGWQIVLVGDETRPGSFTELRALTDLDQLR